jgi:hypothetical protein
MTINQRISGKFSNLVFVGKVVRIDGGLISVVVDNPHRNLPTGPTMVEGRWVKALTFHTNDANVVLN